MLDLPFYRMTRGISLWLCALIPSAIALWLALQLMRESAPWYGYLIFLSPGIWVLLAVGALPGAIALQISNAFEAHARGIPLFALRKLRGEYLSAEEMKRADEWARKIVEREFF